MRSPTIPSGPGQGTSTGNPVLESLRQRTRELHRQAERALDLPRATSSREEYAGLLSRLLAFYAPLEQQLFGALPLPAATTPDWESRRKLPSLHEDLVALGATAALTGQHCTAVPRLASHLERIGAWYVVEGATLGGSVIATQLARQLGITRAAGARFFDVYGTAREGKWDEFCAFLATFPAGRAGPVCTGAEAVFDALRRWLADRPRIPRAPHAACATAHQSQKAW